MISKKEVKNIISNVQRLVQERKNEYNRFVPNLDLVENKFKRTMLKNGLKYLGRGSEKRVFESKKHPSIIVKISLFNNDDHEKEIGVYSEIKTIKNEYYRNKFLKIYGYSEDYKISVCEKLFKPDWQNMDYNNVLLYFQNIIKRIGLDECLTNDIHHENLMVRSTGGKKNSELVLVDLGYSGEKRKILNPILRKRKNNATSKNF